MIRRWRNRSQRGTSSLLVTGGRGTIGRVLAERWQPDRFDVFDLPDRDARDLDLLTQVASGHDAIVHLAWDGNENHLNHGWLADNQQMAVNAFEAAVRAGVPRVVLASSVHADRFWPAGETRISLDRAPVPDSLYGASKVFGESLGRHYADARGLEVVAIRFGGVNPRNCLPEEASERAVWLTHDDCGALVRAAVETPLGSERFRLVVGVSDRPERVHDYGPDRFWPAP